MKVFRIPNHVELEQKLKEIDSLHYKVFLLFFGSEEPSTNQSWCPDCVIADPAIRKILLNVDNSVLLECPVGLKSEWKNSGHQNVYKQNYRVTNVPTLIRWKAGMEVGRCVEGECLNDGKMSELCK